MGLELLNVIILEIGGRLDLLRFFGELRDRDLGWHHRLVGETTEAVADVVRVKYLRKWRRALELACEQGGVSECAWEVKC